MQVNGKVRDKITVAQDAEESAILEAAMHAEKVQPWIDGKTMQEEAVRAEEAGEFCCQLMCPGSNTGFQPVRAVRKNKSH